MKISRRNSLKTVSPALKFVPPQCTPWVIKCVQMIVPFYLRYQLRINRLEVKGGDRLGFLYRDFQAAKARFIIAYRHPGADDVICLQHLLLNHLPREMRFLNCPLQFPVHAHFIYERGLLLQLGAIGHWLLPRMGAFSIYRGKADHKALRTARQLLVNGQFPLAIAPEGHTNGLCDFLGPLEPGIARIGFWGVEDLEKRKSPETVSILPVGIKYTYERPPWPMLHRMLCHLEKVCGLTLESELLQGNSQTRIAWFRKRLLKIGDYLLPLLEQYYNKYYSCCLPRKGSLQERLQAVMSAALSVGETALGLKEKGDSLIERRHRFEQAAWERIFRADIKDFNSLPLLEQTMALRIAREANWLLWHLRLVEHFFGVTGKYVQENPTVERLVDTALLVWELVDQISNYSWPKLPPRLGWRTAKFIISKPLSVTKRWSQYKSHRHQAVRELTEDLESALKNAIDSI